LKSVLCVRGGRAFGPWPLEKEACERFQLDLHKVGIRAHQAPRKQDLLNLVDLLTSVSYPTLIHCKSGADRTGFVTAIYLLVIEHRPVDDALKQLSLRFGHLRYSPAGILRRVIEAYGRDLEAGGPDFRTWVEDHYDPKDVRLHFHPRTFSALLSERLLPQQD